MKLESEAEKLVRHIYKIINFIDSQMRTQPSTEERGKNIAKAMNSLEFDTDMFAHVALKFGFRKISNMKRKQVKDETRT